MKYVLIILGLLLTSCSSSHSEVESGIASGKLISVMSGDLFFEKTQIVLANSERELAIGFLGREYEKKFNKYLNQNITVKYKKYSDYKSEVIIETETKGRTK